MSFEIESGIPLEAAVRSATRAGKYPLTEMDVGHSFFVPLQEGETVKAISQRVRGAAARVTKYSNSTVKFAIRSYDDGVRCWRVV